MALLDFLRKKDQSVRSKKTPEKKPAKVSDVKEASQEKKVEKTEVKTAKKNANFSYFAVKNPHVSEKGTNLSEKDQYVFEVLPQYNKNEIKKAIEGIYGVNVLSVNIIEIPKKKRRLGRTQGFRKAYRKAVIKIKQGQKIEII